jgi:hypothetical protein
MPVIPAVGIDEPWSKASGVKTQDSIKNKPQQKGPGAQIEC